MALTDASQLMLPAKQECRSVIINWGDCATKVQQGRVICLSLILLYHSVQVNVCSPVSLTHHFLKDMGCRIWKVTTLVWEAAGLWPLNPCYMSSGRLNFPSRRWSSFFMGCFKTKTVRREIAWFDVHWCVKEVAPNLNSLKTKGMVWGQRAWFKNKKFAVVQWYFSKFLRPLVALSIVVSCFLNRSVALFGQGWFLDASKIPSWCPFSKVTSSLISAIWDHGKWHELVVDCKAPVASGILRLLTLDLLWPREKASCCCCSPNLPVDYSKAHFKTGTWQSFHLSANLSCSICGASSCCCTFQISLLRFDQCIDHFQNGLESRWLVSDIRDIYLCHCGVYKLKA